MVPNSAQYSGVHLDSGIFEIFCHRPEVFFAVLHRIDRFAVQAVT